MRVLSQELGVTDAELIYELNIAVTEESERSTKLGFGKTKPKVSVVTEKLLAELQSLKLEVTALKDNWNKQPPPHPLQGNSQRHRGLRKFHRSCENCHKASRRNEYTHCWRCGGS